MIEYRRLEKLDSFELAEIKKYSEKAYKTVKRHFKNANIHVEVKTHKLKGKKKYTVNIRVTAPNLVASVKQADWDLQRTFNKAFGNVKKRMETLTKRDSLHHRVKKFFKP